MNTTKRNREILLTCDGLGVKNKEISLDEIVKEAKISAIKKMGEVFNQEAFYANDGESGKLGILIEKYIEVFGNNL